MFSGDVSQEKFTSNGDYLLNIGDGLGFNSQDMRAEFVRNGLNIDIVGLDMSPALKQAQQIRNTWQTIIQGDCQKLIEVLFSHVPEGIIANEVIADLRTYDIHTQHLANMRGTVNDKALLREAGNVVKDYDLPFNGYKDKEIIHMGAIHLLEQASVILPPKGFVWLSEYGMLCPDSQPESVNLHSHTEWEIRFDHLRRVAEKLGFDVRIESLMKVIGIKDTSLSNCFFSGDKTICTTS